MCLWKGGGSNERPGPCGGSGSINPGVMTGEDDLTSGPESITIVTGPGKPIRGLQSSESSDKVTSNSAQEGQAKKHKNTCRLGRRHSLTWKGDIKRPPEWTSLP